MKKLQKLQLKNATIMTAPEMKHITGGYDDGPIFGTCCAQIEYTDGSGFCTICGFSKKAAEDQSDRSGGHWCCDSCSTATWINNLC